MSEIDRARRIEKILREYLLSKGAWIDEYVFHIMGDSYGVHPSDVDTTTIALDRLAEHIALELQE